DPLQDGSRYRKERIRRSRSQYPSVDYESLGRQHSRGIGSQEQAWAHHVLGTNLLLETLPLDMLAQAFFGDPKLPLPLRYHPTRRDRVDTYSMRAQRACQAFCETDDAGLGRCVSRHAALVDHEGGRGEVDDDAAAGRL